jgi:hypothetical protein
VTYVPAAERGGPADERLQAKYFGDHRLGATILGLGACSRPEHRSFAARPSTEFSFTGGYDGPADADHAIILAQDAEPIIPGQAGKPGPVKRIAISHAFTLQLLEQTLKPPRGGICPSAASSAAPS